MKRMLVCIALLIGLGINDAKPDSYKNVRDWDVYCNNSLKCTLQANIESDVAYTFGFERGPEANSDLLPFIGLSAALTPNTVADFNVQGGGKYTIKPEEGSKGTGTVYLKSPDAARALVNAMMSGQLMTLKLATEKGPREIDISLSGVTAGAIYMDDVQQRIGNRDALAKPGDGNPVDAVTRAADLESSQDVPDEVLDFWQNHTAECAEAYGDEDEDLVKRYGAVQISLDQDAQLFLMPCGLPGAYNYPRSVLMFDTKSKAVRQMSFPIMGIKGPTVMENPYNLNWDDRQSLLSAFFKGRGLGDCGSKMSWVLGGDGYYANFELKEAFFKDSCDGNYEDWPQIWPPQ